MTLSLLSAQECANNASEAVQAGAGPDGQSDRHTTGEGGGFQAVDGFPPAEHRDGLDEPTDQQHESEHESIHATEPAGRTGLTELHAPTPMLTERITVRFTPDAMTKLQTAAEQLREVVDPDSGRTRQALASDIVRWAVDEFTRHRITESLFSDPIGALERGELPIPDADEAQARMEAIDTCQ